MFEIANQIVEGQDLPFTDAELRVTWMRAEVRCKQAAKHEKIRKFSNICQLTITDIHFQEYILPLAFSNFSDCNGVIQIFTM